jgi:hypothetical protein
MIELLDSPDNVVACRISGTLDGRDYDRMIEVIEAKLASHPKIGVYADMTGFTDMTGEALAKDLRYNLQKLGEWSRFPRMALTTDKAWLKGLVKTIDPIFPQFEARTFDPGHDAEAIAWAAEIPAVRS